MGLGSARDVTLAQARKRMEEIRINLVSKKIDPMAEREKALELGRVAKAEAVPFRERADQYITAHEGHQLAALLKHVATLIRTLGIVTDHMRSTRRWRSGSCIGVYDSDRGAYE